MVSKNYIDLQRIKTCQNISVFTKDLKNYNMIYNLILKEF